MPDETLLREQARNAIRNGKVPSRRSDRMFGGPGAGQPCVVCGKPLPRTEVAIELEFNRQDRTPDTEQYHFHHRCYVAWEFERGGAFMVELILSEAQLACLKAAVTIGSEESAALGRGVRFGSKLISPEPFAVKCPREIATRLLAVAERFCSDAVPEIRAAIERETQ